MQRTANIMAGLATILFLCCGCAHDKGVVHFGTFYSDKYFRVTVKYLPEPATIQGYPCRRGKIRFHFNDSLLSFRSAAEIDLDNGSIPAGSRIYLYPNGRPENVKLSDETRIQGFAISDKKRMRGFPLSFYNSGELWKFRPVEDVEIDGVFCSHTHNIDLYPDGRLMCCHLAGDIQTGDHYFPEGTRILRDMEGTVHPYAFPVEMATTRLLNIEEHFSAPLVYAYQTRMEGKVDSIQYIFSAGRNGRNPMIHYEEARMKRHRMLGGADVDFYSYLNSASHSWVDPYNVIMAFFSAESELFTEKNKAKLRVEHRDKNYYYSAIEGFESVIEMKPDYHAARLHLVDIYSHIPEDLGGNMEKAKMHAGELLKYDTIWAARAQAMLLPEEAERLDFWLGFRKGHPDNPLLLQELGRAYLEDGDVRNAEICFRRAMALEPAKCTLLIDLACHQLRQVRMDKTRMEEHSSLAEGYLREYIKTNPVNPHKAWCYAKLAWLSDLAGETGEGARFMKQAKRLDMRFSKEETPPTLLLFIPLGEVFTEFESYFRSYSN